MTFIGPYNNLQKYSVSWVYALYHQIFTVIVAMFILTYAV